MVAGGLAGGGLAIVVVLSIGAGVEESVLEVDELALLLLAALFDGAFAGLLAGVACGSEEADLPLETSSAAAPASGTFVTALSPAALALAIFSGGKAFD